MDKKEFIYIGNLNEKKLWLRFTAIDFLILAILGVSGLILALSTFHIEFLIIPAIWGLLSCKIWMDNTSIIDLGLRMLKYLFLSQQTFFWGKRGE